MMQRRPRWWSQKVAEALNAAIESTKTVVPASLKQVLPGDLCTQVVNSLDVEALIAKAVLKTIPFIEQTKTGNFQLLQADVDDCLRLDLSDLADSFRTPLESMKRHIGNAAVAFMKTSVASLARFVVDFRREDGSVIVSE